jgi:hypothetical protein
MQTHVFEHRGYEIVVQPAQNAYGLPPFLALHKQAAAQG